MTSQLNYYAGGGTSKAGLISLICGIVALFLIVPAIPAIIFGVKGIREGRVTNSGVGLSIAGLVLGVLVLLLLAVGIIAVLAR